MTNHPIPAGQVEMTPLAALELVCGDIYTRWDADQRSGKLLSALSGMMSPGYDARVDLIRSTLASTPDTRSADVPVGMLAPNARVRVKETGETGVIIRIPYVVQADEADGTQGAMGGTVWIGEFTAEEIEPIDSPKSPPPQTADTDAMREAEVDRLMHVIDRDRYVVAHCANQIEQAIRGREWLTQGRGPYEWDDDRFYEEFADAVQAIREAAKPLAIVAWDKSDCTRIDERVNAARLAARELLAKPIGPRDMVAADIFGDPRDAEIARLRKLVDATALSPTHTVSDMGVDVQRAKRAIERAEQFAKGPNTTPEEHDDIMVAVRLARTALSQGDR